MDSWEYTIFDGLRPTTELFNEYGKWGWELVFIQTSYTKTSSQPTFYCIFKRKLISDRFETNPQTRLVEDKAVAKNPPEFTSFTTFKDVPAGDHRYEDQLLQIACGKVRDEEPHAAHRYRATFEDNRVHADFRCPGLEE